MTTHNQTCVWVECDGSDCDRDRGWPDDGPFHFDTVTAALGYVLGDNGMGWTQLPDGRLLCRSCSEAADCHATGHQMSSWYPHPSDLSIHWRHCTHCGGAHEERFIEMGAS
jgi:hypothetical protein